MDALPALCGTGMGVVCIPWLKGWLDNSTSWWYTAVSTAVLSIGAAKVLSHVFQIYRYTFYIEKHPYFLFCGSIIHLALIDPLLYLFGFIFSDVTRGSTANMHKQR